MVHDRLIIGNEISRQQTSLRPWPLPTIPDNNNNKNLKKKSPYGGLARHWQDIEKYMHAVEDASVVLTNSPMGVGEKQRRLDPVEPSQVNFHVTLIHVDRITSFV